MQMDIFIGLSGHRMIVLVITLFGLRADHKSNAWLYVGELFAARSVREYETTALNKPTRA